MADTGNTKFDTFINSLAGDDNSQNNNAAEMEKRRKEQKRKQAATKLKSELSKPKPNVNAAKASAAEIVGSIIDENIKTIYVVKALVENKKVNYVFRNEAAKNKWISTNWNNISDISEKTLDVKNMLKYIVEQQYKNFKYTNDVAVVNYLNECSKTAKYKPLKIVEKDSYDTIIKMIETHGCPSKWKVLNKQFESIISDKGNIAEWLLPGTAKYIITYAQRVYNSLG